MINFKKYISYLICGTMLFTCGCSGNTKSKDTSKTEDDRIIRIACVGDSVTQGIGATGWQNGDYTYAYPQQLQQILGDSYEVGNFGKGSSYVYYKDGRDQSLWYPKTAEYTKSNEFNPDIVIIILGTNDARVMASDADAAKWKEQFTELVEHYLDMPTKPEVYIGSGITLQRYDSYKNASETNWTERDPLFKDYILSMQREVAHELNCTFLDMYHDLYDEFTEENTLASDQLHPNNNGYKIIAEYIAEKLYLPE